MNFKKFSKNQLVQIIEELQILNQQLLSESEQMAGLDFAWTGNLGHWYWNIKTNTVTCNPLIITTLGYKKDEIASNISHHFFTEKLHPDDSQRIKEAICEHLNGKTNIYEVEYRIQTKAGMYKWFHDRGQIMRYDEQGKPLLMVGIASDITPKIEMKEESMKRDIILSEFSSTDGLTKLMNHRALILNLSREIDFAKHYQQPLSIAMIVIDDFQKINDQKGYLFSNSILINIAKFLINNTRDSDFVGRYGEEKFMIIFTKTSLSGAANIVEMIRLSIEGYTFDDIKVTVSGGVSEYYGEELTGFIEAANINLFEAIKRGKNQTVHTKKS